MSGRKIQGYQGLGGPWAAKIGCGRCAHWEGNQGQHNPYEGETRCKRHAPKPFIFVEGEQEPEALHCWPITRWDDSCSEFFDLAQSKRITWRQVQTLFNPKQPRR